MLYSQQGKNNNACNLQKKNETRRILVVVVNWRHHANVLLMMTFTSNYVQLDFTGCDVMNGQLDQMISNKLVDHNK